jgi:fructoselysine-6-P-deglycase FrlB-like protein
MTEKYHMIDYIHEDASALRQTLEENEIQIERISSHAAESKIKRVIVCGTGSSFTAAVMATPIFRYHCPIPVHVLSASDLMYYMPRLVDRQTLVVGVSRSGERGQVVNAIQAATQLGASCAGMTGVSGDVEPGLVVAGLPAYPARETYRQWQALARLPELIRRVRELESRLGALEPTNDH